MKGVAGHVVDSRGHGIDFAHSVREAILLGGCSASRAAFVGACTAALACTPTRSGSGAGTTSANATASDNRLLLHRLKQKLSPSRLDVFRRLSKLLIQGRLSPEKYCEKVCASGISAAVLREAAMVIPDAKKKCAVLKVLRQTSANGSEKGSGDSRNGASMAAMAATLSKIIPPAWLGRFSASKRKEIFGLAHSLSCAAASM